MTLNLLSDSLREKHRMRVFESRVLRKIFGPMREYGAGGGAGGDL